MSRRKSWDYMIGKKYGQLTVISLKKSSENGRMNAVCKCSCGNVKILNIYELEKGNHSSCRKCFNGIPYKNYIGKKYGYLTVVDVKKNSAVCKCICGNIKTFPISQLEFGALKSCGECYKGISYKDYIGKKFGYLTITNIQHEKNSYTAFYVCKCGKEKKIEFSRLFIKPTILSCGCLRNSIKALKKISFSHLNIIKASQNNFGGLRYVCRCTCGNEIEVLESDLFTGKVTCCEECKK